MSDWIESAAKILRALPCRCSDDKELDELRSREAIRALDAAGFLKRPADQDGWKLVPVEPTEAMYQAALQSGFEGSFDNFSADFKSACESAPTPEAK